MTAEHQETVEYLKAQLNELLNLADRLDLPLVAIRVSSAIDAIPEELEVAPQACKVLPPITGWAVSLSNPDIPEMRSYSGRPLPAVCKMKVTGPFARPLWLPRCPRFPRSTS